jgi:hypothetical protein
MNEFPKIRIINYLLSPKDGKTIAHCLDFDLVVVHSDQEEAIQRLNAVVKAHIEFALNQGTYAQLSTPAPNEYWERFNKGIFIKTAILTIRVPDIVPIPNPEGQVGVHLSRAAA